MTNPPSGHQTLEGVFAGYLIQPGYTWSKQYLIWPITGFDGLKLLTATPAADFPSREPHKVGRIVVPPGLLAFRTPVLRGIVNDASVATIPSHAHQMRIP